MVGRSRAIVLLTLLYAALTACSTSDSDTRPWGVALCAGPTKVVADSQIAQMDSIGTAGCRGTVVLPDSVCPEGAAEVSLLWDNTTVLWRQSLLPPTVGTPPQTVSGQITFTAGSAAADSMHTLRLRCIQYSRASEAQSPDAFETRAYVGQFLIVAPTMTDRVSAKPGQSITVQVKGFSCATTGSSDQTVIVEWNGVPLGDPTVIREPYAAFVVTERVPVDAEANKEADLAVRCKAAPKAAARTRVAVGEIAEYLKAATSPATPGKPFSVTGAGLDCNEHNDKRVSIYFGQSDGPPRIGRTEAAVVSADQTFSATVVVPQKAAPDTQYVIEASCAGGGKSVHGVVTTARPTATIAVSPSSGKPGSKVGLTVNGLYCAPDSDGVARVLTQWDGAGPVLGSKSGADSAFAAYRITVTVPVVVPGKHTFTAKCGTAREGYGPPPPAEFQVTPTEIVVSPPSLSARAGQAKKVHITGASCINASTDALIISWDSTRLLSLPWNAIGGAYLTVTIPQSAAGEHSLSIGCAQGPGTKQVRVLVPGLELDHDSGAAGSSVTVTGDGFLCSPRKADLLWDNVKTAVVPVRAEGTFIIAVKAPAGAGPHELAATCSGSESADAQAFTVNAGSLAANPARAVVGRHFAVHAAFLPSSCSDFGVMLGQQAVTATSKAIVDDPDSGRTIDLDLSVPDATAAGATKVTLSCTGGPVLAADFEVLSEPDPATDEGLSLTGILATLGLLVFLAMAAVIIKRFRGPRAGDPSGIRITIRPGYARITIGRPS